MLDLNFLKETANTVYIHENSIVLSSIDSKIVFLAHPMEYILNITPPGIRGYNIPVDKNGNICAKDEGVFENNQSYVITDVIFKTKNRDNGDNYCYTEVLLYLKNSNSEQCSISLQSSEINVDKLDVYDFSGLVGQNSKLTLSKNILTIQQFNQNWAFIAKSDNYITHIKQNGKYLATEKQESSLEILLENGIDCSILELNYYDDMLGETTIDFNLYFTTLSVTAKSTDGEIFGIEIDTSKMKVVRC